MDVTPLIPKGQQIIQAYADGVFKVSGASYNHPILVHPEETIAWEIGEVQNVSDLTIEHFKVVSRITKEVDVVLLGTGKDMAFLPADLRKCLKENKLSVDVMTTGAACRTYNVLMAEGRRVACLLFPSA